MRLIAVWLCNCAGLLAAALVVPAISYSDDLGTLPTVAGALVIWLVNRILHPADRAARAT